MIRPMTSGSHFMWKRIDGLNLLKKKVLLSWEELNPILQTCHYLERLVPSKVRLYKMAWARKKLKIYSNSRLLFVFRPSQKHQHFALVWIDERTVSHSCRPKVFDIVITYFLLLPFVLLRKIKFFCSDSISVDTQQGTNGP